MVYPQIVLVNGKMSEDVIIVVNHWLLRNEILIFRQTHVSSCLVVSMISVLLGIFWLIRYHQAIGLFGGEYLWEDMNLRASKHLRIIHFVESVFQEVSQDKASWKKV